MKRKQITLGLPPLRGFAQLQADTIDRKARTVDLIFYSGAPVLRSSYFDDTYELEFEVSDKAADLERLNGGAPLVDSHRTYTGVRGMLGVVERAWLSGGAARATVRFSKREDVEPVWQDVLDGIVRNVSMGVYIFEMEEVTAKDAKLKRYRATSWQPYEVSFIGVQADPGAQTLEAEIGEARPCKITSAEAAAEAQTKEKEMKITVRLLADITDVGAKGAIVEIEETAFDKALHSRDLNPPAPAASDPPAARSAPASSEQMARETDEALGADTAYQAQINRIRDHYDLDDLWARRQIRLQATTEEAIASATAERAKKSPVGANDIGFGNDYEAQEWKLGAMCDALAARARGVEIPEHARAYAGFGFGDVAVECLTFANRGRGLHPRRDAGRIFSSTLALHSTSDFPLLLANALNKILLPAYNAATPSYRAIAARRTFNDFREHNFLRDGDFPVPMKVNEHGEFKYGTLSENNEPARAATYGRIVGLSRQALVNDDLGAFGELGSKAARRVADFENALFYTSVLLPNSGLGQAMSDTNPVFDAAHANIQGTGALTVAILGVGRALMMKQTSLDGLKLNTPASILLVSPDSYTLAEQLTAPLSVLVGQGADAAATPNVNPFAGKLAPVADANLTGARWYLFADPAVLACFIYGYLGDAEGPRTEVRNGFEIDGVEFKLALDFGVGAVDHRGGVTGSGA